MAFILISPPAIIKHDRSLPHALVKMLFTAIRCWAYCLALFIPPIDSHLRRDLSVIDDLSNIEVLSAPHFAAILESCTSSALNSANPLVVSLSKGQMDNVVGR
jgi:hypothetical protein